MGQYTEEAQNILDDFICALGMRPNANRAFVEQLKMLVERGEIAQHQAIQKAIAFLEDRAPNES